MPFNFGVGVSNFEDSTATQCMVSKGDLPMIFKWYLNEQLIYNDFEAIQITRVAKLSTLRIDSLNGKHRGVYKCRVENKAGSAESSAELKINGSDQVFSLIF